MAMHKFPRTPHLAALGTGVTRDDLVMDAREAEQYLTHPMLVVEEKVDGTNLGISFHGPGYDLRLQHRGRLIGPASETQYAKLQGWLDRRRPLLVAALGTRYVMYGEWLAAKHSVHYTRLPDPFLGFDVLDTQTGCFLARKARDKILAAAHVWPVRCVYEGPLPGGLDQLKQLMLNTNSVYCETDVHVEGLYVRQEGSFGSSSTARASRFTAKPGWQEKASSRTAATAVGASSRATQPESSSVSNHGDGCWLLSRAKLVHPSFSQALTGDGGRHWSTRIMTPNITRPDLWTEPPWNAAQTGPANDTDEPAAATGSSTSSAAAEATDQSEDVTNGHGAAAAAAPAAPPATSMPAAPAGLQQASCYTELLDDQLAPPPSDPGRLQIANPGTAAAAAAPKHDPVSKTPVQPAQVERQLSQDSPGTSLSNPNLPSLLPGHVPTAALKPAHPRVPTVSPAVHHARGAAAGEVGQQCCQLCVSHGVLALKGRAVDSMARAYLGCVPAAAVQARQSRFGPSYHITLLSPDEMQQLQQQQQLQLQQQQHNTSSTPSMQQTSLAAAAASLARTPLNEPCQDLLQYLLLLLSHDASTSNRSKAGVSASKTAVAASGSSSSSSHCVIAYPTACQLGSWLPLGLGTCSSSSSSSSKSTRTAYAATAHYVLVCWPAGQELRRALELPQKAFHITLGFEGADVHDVPKELSTLVLQKPQLSTTAGDGSSSGSNGGSSRGSSSAEGRPGSTMQPMHDQGVEGLLQCLPELSSKSMTGHVDAVLAAVRLAVQLMHNSSNSCVVEAHAAAAATLLLAALQAVEGNGTSSSGRSSTERGWQAYGMLTATAAAVLLQADSNTDGQKQQQQQQQPAVKAALYVMTMMARQEGRVGNLSCCIQLAHLAAAAAAAAAAAHKEGGNVEHVAPGAAAYAQLLLGKALFQQGDAAAALAAFAAAGQLMGAAQPVTADSHVAACVRMGGAGVAWLDTALLQLVDPQVVARGVRACLALDNASETSSATTTAEAAAAAAGSGHYSQHLLSAVDVPTALFDPRQRFVVQGVPQVGDVVLMRNTSWLLPGRLLGSSTPTCREHIQALAHLGVQLVVTLTKEGPLPPTWFTDNQASSSSGSGSSSSSSVQPAASKQRLSKAKQAQAVSGAAVAVMGMGSQPGLGAVSARNVLVPVTNYEPPSVEQMDYIMGLTEAAWATGQAVLVHCGGGKGRAGTVLACLLCKHGVDNRAVVMDSSSSNTAGSSSGSATVQQPTGRRQQQQRRQVLPPAMSAAEAIKLLRQQRPGSIETERQEQFVTKYCSIVWERYQRAIEDEASNATASGVSDSGVSEPKGWASGAAASNEAAACSTATTDKDGAFSLKVGKKQAAAAAAATATTPAQQTAAQHPDGAVKSQQGGKRSQAAQATVTTPAAAAAAAAAVGVAAIQALSAQQLPRLIMLVGLPGSGKSSFAAALAASSSSSISSSGADGSSSSSGTSGKGGRGVVWQRVCQDECGGRGAAETAFTNAMLRGGGNSRVILDRCNATRQDRADWLSLALLKSNKRGKPMKGVWAVHFDVPASTCITRVAARTDHPTIPQGRGRRAVEWFAAVLEPPSTQEEGFERVITVRSRRDVDELLALLGADALPETVREPAQQPGWGKDAGWQQWVNMGEEEVEEVEDNNNGTR